MILREHDTARVGARWSDADRVLTDRYLGCLLSHQEREGTALFRPIHRGLKATSWVGSIGIGDRELEVLPKIDDEPNERKVRGNLHAMIAVGGLVPSAETDLAWLGDDKKPLLVAHMDRYVRGLAHEWRRGPIRRYVTEEENRPFLKGKLLLQRQLRTNLVHRERFYTAADELTADNPLSRLLKAALGACLLQRFSSDVAGRARSLMLDFDGVGDLDPAGAETPRVLVDRQSERFAPLVAMARFILHRSRRRR